MLAVINPTVFFNIIPMINPRYRRLESDHEKVMRLIAESGGTLKLISLKNDPPTEYIIEFHCPSLVLAPSGRLILGDIHQVEISLGMDYPFAKPTARMLNDALILMYSPMV